MKHLKITGILGLSTVLFTQVQAQEEKTPKWKPSYFNISIGALNSGGGLFNKEEFLKMAPSLTELSNSDLNWTYYNGDYASSFGLHAEFSRLGKGQTEYRKNQTFRIGLMYQSRTIGGGNGSKYTNTPYDTLTSSRDNSTIVRYTTSGESHYLDYTFEELRLDAAYLLRTDENRRFNLYTGFGVTFGSTFNAKISSSQSGSNSSSVSYPNNNGSYYYSTSNYKSVDVKNTFAMSAYVPLGVDLRWGNKNTFFNRIHSTFEMRPSLEHTAGKTFTSMTYNFGLRIKM